jgi:hypothetical protein
MRASVTPAQMTQTGWAAEIAPVGQAILDSLIPLSAGAAVLRQGHNLTFGGAASFKVPSLTGAAANWIGENAAIRVVDFLSAAPTLSPHKLAAIALVTMEMMTAGNAPAFVRQALLDSCATAIDTALFSNTVASAAQPAGLLVGATAVTASTSADAFDAMGSDVGNLIQAVVNYAGNGGVMLVAAAPQAARYAMYSNAPYPMAMSAALSPGSVIAVATNAIASAIEAPAIDVATQPSLHMDDTTPQTPDASPTKDAYQAGAVALKLRLPISWVARNAAAVSCLSGTTKW